MSVDVTKHFDPAGKKVVYVFDIERDDVPMTEEFKADLRALVEKIIKEYG